MPTEEAVAFADGAIPGRAAGKPGSYEEGGSTRWTPEAISEVHALAQLGRYQIRGFNTFNKRLPTFDDLTFVPATMTRLPLEGYREHCETTHRARRRQGRSRGQARRARYPDLYRLHVLRRALGQCESGARIRRMQSRHHDLYRRRRHAGGRARRVEDIALSTLAVALHDRPRTSAPGQRAGNRHGPGRQARHRRASPRHEGVRARGENALAAHGRRPALHRAPSRFPRRRRSSGENRGAARGDGLPGADLREDGRHAGRATTSPSRRRPAPM